MRSRRARRPTPFAADAEARLGAFAELVAQAIANVDARIKLKESRARIVAAADDARRRIERDLHDGAQQRLVALALSLQLVGQVAPSRPPRRRSRAASRTCTRRSPSCASWRAGSIRRCSRSAACRRRCRRSPRGHRCRSSLDADLDGRLPAAHEAALYFVAAEALTNVAKYAKASAVEVTLHGDDRWAEIAVADDGVGGARAEDGSGLRGLGDRVEALGGRLTLASTRGHGTTVRARVPVARARRRRVLSARVGHSLARRGGACGLIGLPCGDLASDDGGVLPHADQKRGLALAQEVDADEVEPAHRGTGSFLVQRKPNSSNAPGNRTHDA